MAYLLDTCAVSDFAKGEPNTLTHLKAVSPRNVFITSITLMEIRYGMMINPQRVIKIREVIEDFLISVTIIPFAQTEQYDQYAQSGRFLKPTDEEISKSDANSLPMLVEVEELPTEDDDFTILTARQIEKILSNYNNEIIQNLKKQWGIHGRIKSLAALANKLAELAIFTHFKLKNALSDAQRESERQKLLQNTNVKLLNGRS